MHECNQFMKDNVACLYRLFKPPVRMKRMKLSVSPEFRTCLRFMCLPARSSYSCVNAIRSLSSNSPPQPYFVSTPIFYVNAAPHIGHIYTTVLADASARFHKMLGDDPVVFSTGTDEHGLKIQQAAALAGESPHLHCSRVSDLFRVAFDQCEVRHSDFIRTTDDKHKENVQQFWEILNRKGYIYKGKYEGWYCTADEAFVADDQTKLVVLQNGKEGRVSTESNRPVEWFSEENYLFRLSGMRDELSYWLQSGTKVHPARYYNLVKSWLEQDLQDLSVSRPSSRLSWGIPVPGDASQTIYVWLDALLNYLTVAKRYSPGQNVWPPAVHVIGKDILKFHAIYWPAFLLAAGFNPPEQLQVHGHWMVDGEKMSKTTGNVIQPKDCIDQFTASGLRYFLLHEGVPNTDGNFSVKRLVHLVNSDLADSVGNIVNRCCSKSLNVPQIRPSVDESCFRTCGTVGTDLLDSLKQVPSLVYQDYCNWQFYKGIDKTTSLIRAANGLFQIMEPWKLKKEANVSALRDVLAVTMETARIAGILLQPIVPSFSSRLLDKLGVPDNDRLWDSTRVRFNSAECNLGGQDTILFPRIKMT